MWLKVLISVVVVLIASLFAYSKYIESQKDIHELALSQQSNISGSRKPEETAIYRNTLVPFEMPLTTGLSIRQGFKLRNGNLRDIWSVVFDQKHNRDRRIVFVDDESSVTMSLEKLNGVIKRLEQFFTHNDSYTIGITVPLYSYNGFLAALTCFMSSLTLHHFPGLPSKEQEVDLLIIYESHLEFIGSIKHKLLIIVGDDPSKKYKNAINWTELGLEELEDDKFEYKYDPKYDEGIPFLSTAQGQTNEFTHQNFVSSIASIVKTIPLGHEISSKDTLLVDNSNDFSNLSKVFAVLLFGGNVVLNFGDIELDVLITTYKPTIIATSPKLAKSILTRNSNYYSSPWRQLKLLRAENLLSEGVFAEAASSPVFKSVRLFYVSSITNDSLTSSELNRMRILTGARIITERFLPNVLGSILSSNFYDYRILSNKSLQNRGAPSLSLEIKNFEHKYMDIEKKHGQLCIRGFIIGRPHTEEQLQSAIKRGESVGSEGWMPTGIFGKFGNDGCFYEDKRT